MCSGVLHFTFFANKREKLQPALHIIGTSYIGAGILISDTGIERHLGIEDTRAAFPMVEARTRWRQGLLKQSGQVMCFLF